MTSDEFTPDELAQALLCLRHVLIHTGVFINKLKAKHGPEVLARLGISEFQARGLAGLANHALSLEGLPWEERIALMEERGAFDRNGVGTLSLRALRQAIPAELREM